MNRFYNNVTGRFLTPDPFGGSANQKVPLSWNRYTYVGNDPVGSNDPSGLDYICITATSETGQPICYYNAYDAASKQPPDPSTQVGGPTLGLGVPILVPPLLAFLFGPPHPPIFQSAPECEVDLFAQPAVSVLSPLDHTFLEVQDLDHVPHYLEGFPQPKTSGGSLLGPAWLNHANGFGTHLYTTPLRVVDSWSVPQGICNALITKVDLYADNTVTYNNSVMLWWGPNSNSFTHSLLNIVRLSVPSWINWVLDADAPGWINTSVPFP